MLIYDESTARRARARIRVDWSRELTFSMRQINFIRNYVPNERGIYCVYAKDYKFSYSSPRWPKKRWSDVVYIGSGWIDERLCRHLSRRENDALSEFIENHELAYRYALIVDDDEDWPRIAEASLLHLFLSQFGKLPPANRRQESIPDLSLHVLHIDESENFRLVARTR